MQIALDFIKLFTNDDDFFDTWQRWCSVRIYKNPESSDVDLEESRQLSSTFLPPPVVDQFEDY
jgi:hypothetical protein